jgi:hypothetical protein
MRHARRSVLTIATAGLASLITALSGAAAFAAPAGGVKGDPQPELKPFEIGLANGPGSVALEPDGAIVVAYSIAIKNGSAVRVCVLARGGHACTSEATLNSLDGDGLYGPAEVYVTSADHVVVLQNTCCDSDPNSTLLYTSTNGGKTFGAPARVGSAGVAASALIGGQLVWAASGGSIQVQSVSATSPGTDSSTATMSSPGSVDVGVGSYKGGALIASDNDGDGPTYVEYAPAGDNFSSSASYHRVAKIAGQSLIGISGNALLTEQTGGKDTLEISFFNGSSFGAEHAVPGTSGGGPQWFTIDQDPSGVAHVFSARAAVLTYGLIEESTSTGSRWSSPIDLGDAVQSNFFAAGLDSNGSGLVLGIGPAWGYPVLAGQSVSFTLKSSSIKKGKSTTGSGKGSPAGAGRLVTLQVERSGKWYNVATTHENGSGSFSFTIKGSSAGSFSYRAVASDLAGYLLYGYSPARTLRVTG